MGKNRTGPVTVCEKCGIKFRSWRPDRQNRFCSRECAPAGRIAKTPSTKCESCGVLFRRFGGGHAARYCSRKCYLKVGYGKNITNQGYILVFNKEHSVYPNGQIFEHRLVMEQKLGRRLERYETVHHINGDKTDNRIKNLQLHTGKHGKGVLHKCGDCGSTNIINGKL